MARALRLVKSVLVYGGSAVLLLLILVWFAGGFEDKIEPGSVDAPARRHQGEPTAPVILVHEPVVETAVGTIEARESTQVSSQILATIGELRVRSGDVVQAGQVVAVLDSRDLQARVAQGDQAVAATEAEAERTRADLNRLQSLFDEGVVNQAELDSIQSAARVAEAERLRAQRARDEAQIALSHAEIEAPIGGRVVERLAEPGDVAVPGEPLLTIYNPEALRLEAPVRERLATRLRVGDPLRVHVDTLDRELVGEVEEIVPQAASGSRSFLVRVRVPTVPGLYTGMFGRLLIPAGERERLCVPASAVDQMGQLEYVDVLTDEGTVERRLIRTGEHREGIEEIPHVEVLSGLASGETVLVNG